MDILETIILHKRTEVAQALRHHTTAVTTERTAPRRSMRRALESSATGIIAEFKRRSPSKGWIHSDADPRRIVPAYEAASAAACSILTDGAFFGGSIDDLRSVRSATSLPLLRKEFIIDKSQIDEADIAGADAVLLIASVLSVAECRRLAAYAHRLGLEVLLEVHTTAELDRLDDTIDMLGVNNRDLGTFHTDPHRSLKLAQEVHHAVEGSHAPLLISESGLSDAAIVLALRDAGYRGFLMGEAFMRSPDPSVPLRALIESLTHTPTPADR